MRFWDKFLIPLERLKLSSIDLFYSPLLYSIPKDDNRR
ncbi:hypothetical protein LEP1GSC105_3700 [Leptospira interrogans str. UI 12758]|uniref:Uncharacterized protein n=1 Tax=Leptospira interrogans str. UI 12758 TaxID=1049938 RepID=A0A0E2DK48_LEPIR|nr:hypothetical protein LEP1GSC105_3700 [Leptospira interrogans str. UI 12758]